MRNDMLIPEAYHQGQFPPQSLDWPRLLPLIGPANAAIARYEGVLHGVAHPNVLLSPLTSQEAVLSSRIEGTQATLGEVLEFEAQGNLFDESTPKLVQLAVAHAEFEAIHPFLDGNGRLGRLIVPLFLFEKGLLSSPNFYISAYLDEHRDEYYSRLLAVSRDGDWTGWCAFFLTALIEQSRANQQKALAILSLYRERKDWIATATRSQYAVKALDWIFARPIFSSADFVHNVQIPKPTANCQPHHSCAAPGRVAQRFTAGKRQAARHPGFCTTPQHH